MHRDLKPENIFLDCSFAVAEERINEGNYEPVAKVGDFGLAVVMNGLSFLRREKKENFDPHYATPEQLKGQHYTTSSDVFAFGSILWELTRRKKVFHDVCVSFLSSLLGVCVSCLFCCVVWCCVCSFVGFAILCVFFIAHNIDVGGRKRAVSTATDHTTSVEV